MSARTTATPSDYGVGISLIRGEESFAIHEQLRNSQPGVTVTDRGVYLKAAAAEEIVIDLADLSDRLGRAMNIEDVLVVVATYFGEIDPRRGKAPGTGQLVLRAENLDPAHEPEESNR